MKKAIAAMALLVVTLAGFVFLLPLMLNSDTLRAVLSRQLSDASGADISFRGPIRFSIVPDFGIVAEDLRYVSGDGSVSVTSERSVASVNLMSLLSDQIRITGIALRNPHIVLASTAIDKAGVQSSSEAVEDQDVFKLAATYLERLSIDRLEVSNGEIAEHSGGVDRSIASKIDLRLSIPGISEPASLAISGLVGGDRMELTADIGSLRNLLDRQPAEFSLSATTERPPHPALADLSASGSIQLANDGSYRIVGGEIDSAGQKMEIDASYVPGDRPFIRARIAAGTLDYSDFQPAETAAADHRSDRGDVSDGGLDLSALRDFDADVELRADAMRAGDAVARDIVMQAELLNGRLNSTVSSQQIAGGSLAASMVMNVKGEVPETSGSLNISAIDIERLMLLAGRQAPASGRLSSELQYAFIGLDAGTVRDSVNARGVISINDGLIDVPQLAEITGPGTSQIDALDVKAEIADISQPLAVSGTARWNGEAIGFSTSIALANLLSGQPGTAMVELRSNPIAATISGTIRPDGGMKGNADIAAASLSRALSWLGHDIGTPLGQFSYSGGIAVEDNKFTLSDAAIALDDLHANGSVSVGLAGKTTITAALSVDTLDFEKLTGGADVAGEAPASGSTSIDLAVLRQLDADIRLDAKLIGYGAVKAGPASATLTVKDGVAHLMVPQAGFYDGIVTADVKANGAGEIPAIDFAARLDEVSALPLLSDAAGFQRLEGRLTAEVSVSGSGDNTDTLARALNGKASVIFSDGALRGIDVAKLVNNLQSLIRSGYEDEAGGKTEFTELSVSLNIENGIGRTEDLRLLGPFVRMDGGGSVDFAAQTIDMRLNPRLVGSLDGQGGDFDVSGLGMPIILEGALAGPRIYPDISGILRNPEHALQTLTRLGGSVGELATGASDTAAMLKDKLGVDSGSAADGVVSGLIDRLGGQSAETQTDNARDLVGSLLQGMVGRQAPGTPTGGEAAIPPEQRSIQPAGTLPLTGTGTPETAFDEEASVVLPTGHIPVPTPNPRRAATTVPTPVQEPDAPKTLADQAVDVLTPQIGPEADKNKADLIKGLIEQIGR